jgi:two-component system response regulator ChvI
MKITALCQCFRRAAGIESGAFDERRETVRARNAFRRYRVAHAMLGNAVDASGSNSGPHSESRRGIQMAAELEQSVVLSPSPVPAVVTSDKTDVIRVLLVEDDESYREILADELSEYGFSVQSFGDGTSLLASVDAALEADIIVLDWSLPKTLGIDLLPQLRRRGVSLPIVFLTGRALTEHESLAFDRGAIDFIDKARGVDVLVKRLRRAVEAATPAASHPQAEKSMVCGKLVLKPSVSRAYWNQVDVGLTLGEYNIVHLLASNAGRYVTYRAIYDRLHYEGFIAGSGEHGYRANVRSAIKRIRNKFRDCDPAFVEIENYTAFGYCWGKPSGIG